MSIKEYESDDEQELAIEAKDTRKANLILWMSYDAADNFFSQCVISLAFTPFAMLLGVELGWTLVTTFIVVSIFMAGSNLLIAIFGPLIGAISDTAGKRKRAVITVAAIMIACTLLIFLFSLLLAPDPESAANKSLFWITCVLFVIGNFCYQAGRMLYDSQIPFVTDSDKRSIYQAIGGALAPIGSFLGIAAGLVSNGIWGNSTSISTAIWELTSQEDIDSINYESLRWLFLIAAGVLLIMIIPYLFHKEVENPTELDMKENVKKSFVDVKRSFITIIKDRNSWLFFLAWFFTVDAANTTILYMVPVVEGACGVAEATSLGTNLTYLVIGVGILLSMVFGVVTGYLLDRFGNRITFLVSGIAWMVAIVLFMIAGFQWVTLEGTLLTYHVLPWWLSFVGAFFIGIGFGGVWIIGRQFIMVLAPPSKLAQYAGFQKIAGRVSAIVSPLIFAGMMFLGGSVLSGGPTNDPTIIANHSYRLALASILLFFIIGSIFAFFIIDPHERYKAGERAPYPGIYDKDKPAK